MSLPMPVPKVSPPLICIGSDHEPPGGLWLTNTARWSCQMTWMVSLNGDCSLWSTHIICLSAFSWSGLEIVSSRFQVAPLSVDLKECRKSRNGVVNTLIVVAQAVPSEVHSTAGSDWKDSPMSCGSTVCFQEAPPSVELNIASVPPPCRLL